MSNYVVSLPAAGVSPGNYVIGDGGVLLRHSMGRSEIFSQNIKIILSQRDHFRPILITLLTLIFDLDLFHVDLDFLR